MHYVIFDKTVCICAVKHTYAYALCFDKTVCICAANDELTGDDTFYKFNIFYTMGNVARAIVYIIKCNGKLHI
jgi:hypothetical protein